MLKLERPWKKQPECVPRINWSNPLTNKLRAVFVPVPNANTIVELISGLTSSTGTYRQRRSSGSLVRYNTTASTASFNTVFGMPQNNCAMMVVGYNFNEPVIGANHGCYLKCGNTDGFGFGVAGSDGTFDASGNNTQSLIGLYESIAWKVPASPAVIPNGGTPFGACMRINGDNSGGIYAPGLGDSSWSNASTPIAPTTSTWIGSSGAPRTPLTDEFLIGIFWSRVPTNSEVDRIYANPWQLCEPRRIWVPQAGITGLPTLTISTYKPGSLSSSGWTPRITAS